MKSKNIDNKSGIYTITNLINGKIYVGFCQNFKSRYNNHKYTLINNKHGNEYLQSAYNKYGKENFIFEILEYCDKQCLASQEHYWCNFLNTHNRKYGYNIQPTDPNNLKRHSEETILKIKTNTKNIKKSEETKKRISKGLKGKPKSLEHRKNLSKVRTGLKIIKKDKIKVYKKLIIQMDLQGNFIKEWKTAAQAARELGIKRDHIHDCCKGIRKSSYNFKWEYNEIISVI